MIFTPEIIASYIGRHFHGYGDVYEIVFRNGFYMFLELRTNILLGSVNYGHIYNLVEISVTGNNYKYNRKNMEQFDLTPNSIFK